MIVVKAGISPVPSNLELGPIRTMLYRYAFVCKAKRSGEDAYLIITCDDSNPKWINKKEYFFKIFKFYSKVLNIRADIHPLNARKKIGVSLFQSERSEIYQKYLDKLIDRNIAIELPKEKIVVLDLRSFVKEYQEYVKIRDILRGTLYFPLAPLVNSKTPYIPLTRSDGSFLYLITAPVDDYELKVTHVIRGEDQITAAYFHELIRIGLNFPEKLYLHLPLLLDERGRRLKGIFFSDLLKEGFMRKAIISYLLSSGYGNPSTLYHSFEEFVKHFDVKKIHRQSARFDKCLLRSINSKFLKISTEEEFLHYIYEYGRMWKRKEIISILKSSYELQQIILSRREEAPKSWELLERILDPKYEALNPKLQKHAREILTALKQGERIDDIKERIIEKPLFYQSLRWILLGCQSGIEFPLLQLVISYLIRQNKLFERLKKAEIVLQNTN